MSPNGVIAAQTESPWDKDTVIKKVYDNIASNFKYVKPYLGMVPTYPAGAWSWTVASNRQIELPYDFKETILALGPMKYLNKDMAKACFALPEFYKKKLQF